MPCVDGLYADVAVVVSIRANSAGGRSLVDETIDPDVHCERRLVRARRGGLVAEDGNESWHPYKLCPLSLNGNCP